MVSEYFVINLNTAIEVFSLERVKDILSTFSCDLNDDIESFLKERAIDFSNKGIARTHLVLREAGSEIEILGYYTLTNKVLAIPNEGLSGTERKRVERFGVLDINSNTYDIPMPLIAQLGKNYLNGLNNELSGAELLFIASDKVAAIQNDLGGRFVYLECDDAPKLIDFYTANGFRCIENSKGDNDLVQMIMFQ